MSKIINHQIWLFVALLSLTASAAGAHGGVDDEPAGPVVASAPDQLSLASYPGAFEVLLRYAAPKLHTPTVVKMFISDWATNKPVNAIGLSLEFPGNKDVRVTKPLTRIGDGTYQAQITFEKDGSYSGMLKFAIGEDQQLAVLSPIYAGTPAVQHLSPSAVPAPTTWSIPSWMIILGVLLLLILAVLIGRYIKGRKESQLVVRNTIVPS